jgi:hypothetical protein
MHALRRKMQNNAANIRAYHAAINVNSMKVRRNNDRRSTRIKQSLHHKQHEGIVDRMYRINGFQFRYHRVNPVHPV